MSVFQLFSFFLPLAYLWLHLINHLRVEWSLNEQYSYGWAVPFLCAYLLWKRLPNPLNLTRNHNPHPNPTATTPPSSAVFSSSSFLLPLAFVLLAFLYLPIRLIEEANPEWRLVSWSLALVVLGLTLGLVPSFLLSPSSLVREVASPTSPGRPPSSGLRPRTSALVFPLCYFLVAVPWPTIIEGPLIQLLTRGNVFVTIELLNLIGIPAVQHGNVIEIATGMVGVDEACSGIRSFQATLMISLFLGEYYRLSVRRRVTLCLTGFALSFIFNVGRAGLLTWVAARDGVAAIGKWHDPAGVIILLGCFTGLWAVGVWLQHHVAPPQPSTLNPQPASPLVGRDNPSAPPPPQPSTISSQPSSPPVGRAVPCAPTPSSAFSISVFQHFSFRWGLALAVWLLFGEIAVEGWYRAHESHAPAPVVWNIKWPTENASLKSVPVPATTRRILRYDECQNMQWIDGAFAWQGIFLRWDPGRTAVHLAKNHTPEICLTAAGHRLLSTSDVQWLAVRGLRMPFRIYSVGGSAGVIYVFYCLWEDRGEDRNFDSMSLQYGVRLAPVLAGRRQGGQRSLEVVIMGAADEASATGALQSFLESNLQVASASLTPTSAP